MQLTLIGKNTLYKMSLPMVIEGNYWLTDHKKRMREN